MSPQEILLKKLEKHPGLVIAHRPSQLRIEPPISTGFAVELHSLETEWTAYLGEAGFHETFDDPDKVLNFVAWCYSGNARVREIWRGNMPVKAILEANEHGRWKEISETGYLFFTFWQMRREVILTNPNILRS